MVLLYYQEGLRANWLGILTGKSAGPVVWLPQDFDELPAEIDHIIAEIHGGRTIASNVALSCLSCNRHKWPNLAGIDPKSARHTRLFHPRRHSWSCHFRWEGTKLRGKTAFGRTTICVLKINAALRVLLREELIATGLFNLHGD